MVVVAVSGGGGGGSSSRVYETVGLLAKVA